MPVTALCGNNVFDISELICELISVEMDSIRWTRTHRIGKHSFDHLVLLKSL